MNDIKQYISTLFTDKNMLVPKNRTQLFEAFIQEETTINAVRLIQENQKMMIDKWKIKSTIQDIIDKHLVIPNAMVDKPYLVSLDLAGLGMNEIVYSEFENLENYGLEYDNETETIKGNPTQSGDFLRA